MGAFISKQPNGLYCRFSTIVDCPTHWNMTAEDYIEMKAQEAREEAKDVLKNHLKPFDQVIKNYVEDNNMTADEWQQFLIDVGVLEVVENTEYKGRLFRDEIKEILGDKSIL